LKTISITNVENKQITNLIKEIKETQKTEIINTNTQVILLGFNHFRIYDLFFSFYIYFTPIQNIIFSRTIRFTIIITYHSNIRSLKETKGNCTLQNNFKRIKISIFM
jgi:hypothetical protein